MIRNLPIYILDLLVLGIAIYLSMYLLFEILRIWLEVVVLAMIEK